MRKFETLLIWGPKRQAFMQLLGGSHSLHAYYKVQQCEYSIAVLHVSLICLFRDTQNIHRNRFRCIVGRGGNTRESPVTGKMHHLNV